MSSALRNSLATLSRVPAMVSIAMIRIYQKTISPDHGPLRHFFPYGYCRHQPTCSEYGIEVLKNRSFPKAIILTVKRIASCNPWTKVSDEKLKAVIGKTM